MEEDTRIGLKVITLSEELEVKIRNNIIKNNNGTSLELNTHDTLKLMDKLEQSEDFLSSIGLKGVPIICRPDIRLYFRRFIEKKYPRTQVISYVEVPPNYKIDVIGTIEI